MRRVGRVDAGEAAGGWRGGIQPRMV